MVLIQFVYQVDAILYHVVVDNFHLKYLGIYLIQTEIFYFLVVHHIVVTLEHVFLAVLIL